MAAALDQTAALAWRAMTSTERWLASIMMAALIGLLGWLMATVSVNTSRISVLEQRASNHHAEMEALRKEIVQHRVQTESSK